MRTVTINGVNGSGKLDVMVFDEGDFVDFHGIACTVVRQYADGWVIMKDARGVEFKTYANHLSLARMH